MIFSFDLYDSPKGKLAIKCGKYFLSCIFRSAVKFFLEKLKFSKFDFFSLFSHFTPNCSLQLMPHFVVGVNTIIKESFI